MGYLLIKFCLLVNFSISSTCLAKDQYMLSIELPKEHYILSRLEIIDCITTEFYS
jgi:hypothetical protein